MFLSDFKKPFFLRFFSTDVSKSGQQKFSPQFFEVNSQLCFGYTHNFLLLVIIYFFGCG